MRKSMVHAAKWASFSLLLFGCGRQGAGPTPDGKTMASSQVAAVTAQVPSMGKTTPANPRNTVLFADFGGALVPFGCTSPEGTGIVAQCAPPPTVEAILFPSNRRVQARLERVSLESLEDVTSAWIFDREQGRFSDDLEGFALSGASLRLRTETASCSSVIQERVGPGAVSFTLLKEKTMQLLRSKSLIPAIPIELGAVVATSRLTEQQSIYPVCVKTSEDRSAIAQELELPATTWFLFAHDKGDFMPISIERDFDFGLGEGARIVGVLDLDGDGTDELLTVWQYAGGEVIELLVRVGPSAFRRIGKIQRGT